VRVLLRIAAGIDAINRWLGRAVAWLTLAMVVIGAYNAIARYLGRWIGRNLSSNAYLELQWYMFSAVFLLAAAATLERGAHVRVDVFYGRLKPRARAWIDLLGTIFFLVPFSLACLVLTWPTVRNSWAVREVSPDPDGLVRYPIKAVILLAFALLLLQAFAEIVKNVAVLRGERAPTGQPSSGEPA